MPLKGTTRERYKDLKEIEENAIIVAEVEVIQQQAKKC